MKTCSTITTVVLGILTGCAAANQSVQVPEEAQPQAIRGVMAQTADWQLANPARWPTAGWHYGAFHAGLCAWSHMADSDTYYEALKGFGQENAWQPYERIYHADDYVVGIMYLDMFKQFNNPMFKQGIRDRLDYILQNPSAKTLEFKKARDSGLSYRGAFHGKDRWWWCDALFMGPPVWTEMAALTGNSEYLDFMNHEWWATTDYLYDTDEHLYFRDDRYFDEREENGEKIFWSRGNGWVFGGLVMVLDAMPTDYPYRDRYVQLYEEMAAKIAAIQPEDGMWRASLLDPDSYPTRETSGTGFFTYGLAWGVNRGYLDRATYAPAIYKAWQGLVDCVHPNGKLGYVQPVGADPRRNIDKDQTEVYGVGAFLLAGSEVYKMAVSAEAEPIHVHLTNPLTTFRKAETISLDWSALTAKQRALTADNVGVFDFKYNRFIVTQCVDNNGNGRIDELLFQVDMAPGEKRWFWVMPLPEGVDSPQSPYQSIAMHVPDRKDDFSWENDRIGYRVYGKALEDDLVSSGVDPWIKRVRYPVVREFYDSGDYHTDHGKGLNLYRVGQTLGAGGAGIIHDRKLYRSANYRDWKILANGPIRSLFELTYDPWEAGDVTVAETKRISLDLGSNLSGYEIHYRSQNPGTEMMPAAGIIARQGEGDRRVPRPDQGWLSYWEPKEPIGGTIGDPIGVTGVGIVFEPNTWAIYEFIDNHLLLAARQACNEPFVYYSGAGWSESEDFDHSDDWEHYVADFARRLANPIIVNMYE